MEPQEVGGRQYTDPLILFFLLLFVSFRFVSFPCRPPSDREKGWAGICLPSDEILSAAELHERFTNDSPSPVAWFARLLVLCACSSGKRLETTISLFYKRKKEEEEKREKDWLIILLFFSPSLPLPPLPFALVSTVRAQVGGIS